MANAAEHHVGRGDVIAARPAPPWSRLAPLPAGTRPRGCPAPRVEPQPVLDEHGAHKISGALSQPEAHVRPTSSRAQWSHAHRRTPPRLRTQTRHSRLHTD